MMQQPDDRTRSGRMSVLVLALVCAFGLMLSACGSQDDSASDGGEATAAATAKAPSPSAEKATGEPIKVGFLVLDQGVGGNPEVLIAEQAAVKRINEQADGINGRPLDVSVCHVDASPEKNIACANRFVQENVGAVIDSFDYASGAVLPILHEAKIPLVGPAAFAPQPEADRASFYFGPSQGVFGISPLLSFKQQGLKDITFAGGDIPAARGYGDGFIAPAAKGLGLNFKAVYYPVSNPNFQSIAATIAATKPQVGGNLGSGDEGQCTSLVQALRAVGYENTIFAGFCTRFIDEVGATKAGKVQLYSSVWLPQMKQYAPAEVQRQLEMAEGDLQAAGDPSGQGFYSYATYAGMMTLADVLRSIDGPVDSASITKALKAVKDMPSFLGPKISCDGTKWPKSSACTNQIIVATLQPDGSVKPDNEGGFLEVSPSVLSPST